MKKLLFLLGLTYAVLAGQGFGTEDDSCIYLLAAGQSNMARSNFNVYGQADFDVTTSADVEIFNSYNNSFEVWDLNSAGQSAYIGFANSSPIQGSTLAYHAAKEIARSTGKTVRVIASARGGQAISFWGAQLDGGDFEEAAQGWQWILSQKPFVPRLDGVLWHQLESNATDAAGEYQTALRQLMTRVRTEFSAPALPWIAGESTVDGFGGQSLVALRAMDANDAAFPNFYLISRPINATHFIGVQGIHFDDNGTAHYGIAYGQQFLKVFRPLPTVQVFHLGDGVVLTDTQNGVLFYSQDLVDWQKGDDHRFQQWSFRQCYFQARDR